MEKYRSRTFDLLLYEEDETHLNCLQKLATGYQFVALKHDKDVWSEDDEIPEGINVGDLKKAHWHVVLRFPQARWDTAVSAELGIARNYIRKCVSYDGSLLYLVHKGIPDKYQYSPDEAIGPLVKDLKKVLENESDINEKMQDVIDVLDDKEFWTMRAFLQECVKRGRGGMALRMGSLVKPLIMEHNDMNSMRRYPPDSGAYDTAIDQSHFRSFVDGYTACERNRGEG